MSTPTAGCSSDIRDLPPNTINPKSSSQALGTDGEELPQLSLSSSESVSPTQSPSTALPFNNNNNNSIGSRYSSRENTPPPSQRHYHHQPHHHHHRKHSLPPLILNKNENHNESSLTNNCFPVYITNVTEKSSPGHKNGDASSMKTSPTVTINTKDLSMDSIKSMEKTKNEINVSDSASTTPGDLDGKFNAGGDWETKDDPIAIIDNSSGTTSGRKYSRQISLRRKKEKKICDVL